MNVRDEISRQARERALTTTAMRASPRWTAALDAEIIQTEGKYAEIAALAMDSSMSIQTIQARWHVLRVG